MKIAMRLFVLTVMLSVAGFSQSTSFAGPGTPPMGPAMSTSFAGPGTPPMGPAVNIA